LKKSRLCSAEGLWSMRSEIISNKEYPIKRSIVDICLRKVAILSLSFFFKLSLQRETVILMYHAINSINDFHAVDPREFKRQIEYLRRNYKIVSLDEIVGFVKGDKNLPQKTVAITFDDGFRDCYFNVYPYCQRYELPITIFVTTGYVGKEWPWSGARSRVLGWNEIEEMSQNGIEFGAHTVTHPDLQKTTLDEAEDEILMSKKEIEEHIGKNVKYFSYPFGRHTPKISEIVRSCGFEGAVGGGGTIHKSTQLFVLNRVQVDSSVSMGLFKARLTKAVDWSNQLEQIAKKILASANPVF